MCGFFFLLLLVIQGQKFTSKAFKIVVGAEDANGEEKKNALTISTGSTTPKITHSLEKVKASSPASSPRNSARMSRIARLNRLKQSKKEQPDVGADAGKDKKKQFQRSSTTG